MPTLAEAFVDIIGRDTGLAKAMTKAQADVTSGTNKMQARLTQFANGMKVVGAKMGLYVTAPIVGAMALSVKAAAEAEDAQNRLQSTLQKTGSLSSDSMQKFSAFASQIQKLTVYDDELILTTMAYGHNLGIQADQLEDATKAAAGLAAKFRIDLQTAMMLLGRASQGNTMMLKRYGIVLDENLSPQEKFNALIKIGTSNFKLAEAEARTASGQLKQFRNQVDDLAEEFGKALLPVLKTLLERVKSLAEWFQKLTPRQKDAIVTAGLLVAALGPLLSVIGNLCTTLPKLAAGLKAIKIALSGFTMNPIVLAAAVAVAAIAAVTLALMGLRKQLDEWQRERDAAFTVPGLEDKPTPALEAQLEDEKRKERERAKHPTVPTMIPTEVSGEDEARRSRILMLETELARRKAEAGHLASARTAGPGPSPVKTKPKAEPVEEKPGVSWAEVIDRAIEAIERAKAAARAEMEKRISAWQTALGLYEDAQVRMTAITEGETAARVKQIDIEASHRRKTILDSITDETRRAALLKALDADVADQKSAIVAEDAKSKADAAKAEADRKRSAIGFLGGGLSEVWRGAMTAGARLAVPEAPAVTESNRLSQAQLDELKTISGLLGRQIDEAKGSINKLSGAMAAT